MSLLKAKIVLITGGNSGIGLAIAQRFVAEGAFVFVTGRRQVELEQVKRELKGNVCVIQADMTDSDDLQRVFKTIHEVKGRLDSVVVNAGLSEYATLASSDSAHLDRTFNLNVKAALLSVQQSLPLMTTGGSIVLIGSIAGFIGTEGYGTYSASKAALRSYARTWTKELAPLGIRVNTLSPGPIETAMFASVSDEMRTQMTSAIPLGRLGKPEEVAAAALFLASDESRYIAGAELCIDGGMAQV